jgi:hypothetical protein
MIKFTVELEDVIFTATPADAEGNEWVVFFAQSAQAQRDFGHIGTSEIRFNNQELSALLFLAANGDNGSEMVSISAMYTLVGPKLVNVPWALRPIP